MQLQLFTLSEISSPFNTDADQYLGQPYKFRFSVAKKATSQRYKTCRGVCP